MWRQWKVPDLRWALPATNRCMASLQIVMFGAPTSLASIMVIGPHHAAVTHVGGSSEVGQREHMVRQGGSQESAGLSSCVLVDISPRRAKLGGLSRGMRSVGTPPPISAAGAPPAGPWQEPNWVYSYVSTARAQELNKKYVGISCV
jgi:hypothetical protein